jgi:hypothetical protein
LMYPLRWNQASSVKNVSFGSRTPSCTACKKQLQKCILLLWLHSSVTWTCVILYSCRCKFLVALQAVVFEICACWANHARDLRGECFNLAPFSTSISSVSTAFCLVYFLSKKDPVEHTFFTNLKIVDEAGIPMAKPSFTRFIGFLFHTALV